MVFSPNKPSPVSFPGRILHSLVPPFVSQRYNRIHVDVPGPLLAVLLLNVLLHYGHGSKDSRRALAVSPTATLAAYAVAMPAATFALNRCARSTVSFRQLLCLLGYSLYGHVLTIGASCALADERSDAVFFACMVAFGGCATLRLALLLLGAIELPAARLLVCSFVAMAQLLFLVFVHFAYMHPTFVYGRRAGGRVAADAL